MPTQENLFSIQDKFGIDYVVLQKKELKAAKPKEISTQFYKELLYRQELTLKYR